MFYGIYTPNFGAETTPRLLADLVAGNSVSLEELN
jgi:hypothetical protein